MVRDDLYITIPSFFRCPISLDVMKSPVSLSTGVTYDRVSIQRWLDSGNNTCPATMQVLQSKEFVPNRNLQRLIQIWSDSVQRRRAEESAVNSGLSREQVKDMIKEMEMETRKESRFEYLSKIVCFARESEENQNFLAAMDGFVRMIIDLLSNVDVNFVEQVIRVLDMILNKIPDRQELANLILKSDSDRLSSLLLVLQESNLASRIGAVRILEAISFDAESKLLIAEKDGVLKALMKSISPETDPTLIEASLSCLIAISMPKRAKLKLIHLKPIAELSKLLTEQSTSVSITEKVLKLVEMISSCKEGRLEICNDAVCVQAVVQKLLKVSNTSTEHAVTVLWSVCYLFRDQKAQEAVTKSNGLTKILLLMQSNCPPAVRHLAPDLLKIFRVNSKSCLSSYDTKTTHIMPF